MHGIVRLLPSREVASGIPTVRWGDLEIVVVVDVARGASRHLAAIGHQRMRIRQRESNGVVVKSAVHPLRDGMAGRASRSRRWETRREVIGHVPSKGRSALPRRGMAAHTVHGIQRVVVADVAGETGRWRGRHVRARERESRHAVVEGSGIPALGGVAVGAIRRGKSRPGGGVRWIIRLLPLCQVASRVAAIRWRDRQVVVVVDVARSAWHIGVAIGQKESR